MPFCVNCGGNVSPEALTCPHCGHPGPAAGRFRPSADGYDPLAIIAFACAVAGFTLVPLVGSIAAVILGNMAKKNFEQNPALKGEELVRAALIIGWIGVTLAILVLAGALLVFGIATVRP